jgi:hypothetical protein
MANGVRILSYADALQVAHRAGGPIHALLGNGFSRACRDNIFSYAALFDRADFRGLSDQAKSSFEALNTTDFEHVIRALKQTAAVVSVYRPTEADLANTLVADADRLREVLVGAIANSHPNHPNEIAPESYAACKTFLSAFDRVYTLNYDLLLYWAYMQNEILPVLQCDDGFRKPSSGDEPYVTWEVENSYQQKVYYVHGALHLFDAGSEIQKYTWANTGVRLTDQVRAALGESKYPLFVSEGTSAEKLEKIKHNGYLHRVLASLPSIGGTLVVYGFSFAQNDEHIISLIEKSAVTTVLISLYGDPGSQANRAIIARSHLMAERRANIRRRAKVPLNVLFFDAQSAHVWGV